MVLIEYSGAGGKLIHEKNQKQKISWHYLFKAEFRSMERRWDEVASELIVWITKQTWDTTFYNFIKIMEISFCFSRLKLDRIIY